jgi:diguanylate cyclase (GGDEF)-like protein
MGKLKVKVKAGISLIAVFIVFLVLIVFVTVISLHTVNTMSGNAKVVNYAGIVRGGSQKLFKMELAGVYNDNTGKYGESEIKKRDQLINRLSKIINGLQSGNGGTWGSKDAGNFESFKFSVPDDEVYKKYMQQIQESWEEIQKCIYEVRESKRTPEELYDLTEDYFVLCNNTVAAAELYSENQVVEMRKILIAVNVIFIIVTICTVVMMFFSEHSKRKAERLGKLAYTDALTTMNNRASCEKFLDEISNRKLEDKKSIGIIMFDMNNLKIVNDFLGHQGGDKIIRAFSGILAQTAEKNNMFAGRYGGDEFLIISDGRGKEDLTSFLTEVETAVKDYNTTAAIAIEKISFAAGSAFSPTGEDISVYDLIYRADMEMYEKKRTMKKATQPTADVYRKS